MGSARRPAALTWVNSSGCLHKQCNSWNSCLPEVVSGPISERPGAGCLSANQVHSKQRLTAATEFSGKAVYSVMTLAMSVSRPLGDTHEPIPVGSVSACRIVGSIGAGVYLRPSHSTCEPKVAFAPFHDRRRNCSGFVMSRT